MNSSTRSSRRPLVVPVDYVLDLHRQLREALAEAERYKRLAALLMRRTDEDPKEPPRD
jgi:hypothetical protein